MQTQLFTELSVAEKAVGGQQHCHQAGDAHLGWMGKT